MQIIPCPQCGTTMAITTDDHTHKPYMFCPKCSFRIDSVDGGITQTSTVIDARGENRVDAVEHIREMMGDGMAQNVAEALQQAEAYREQNPSGRGGDPIVFSSTSSSSGGGIPFGYQQASKPRAPKLSYWIVFALMMVVMMILIVAITNRQMQSTIFQPILCPNGVFEYHTVTAVDGTAGYATYCVQGPRSMDVTPNLFFILVGAMGATVISSSLLIFVINLVLKITFAARQSSVSI